MVDSRLWKEAALRFGGERKQKYRSYSRVGLKDPPLSGIRGRPNVLKYVIPHRRGATKR